METMSIIYAAWFASVLVGGYVAAQKRRPMMEGVILGALLGPVGLIVEANLPQGDRMPDRPGFLSRWI